MTARSFRAQWSDEDAEYVATCDEYPSLSWLAPDEHNALVGIMQLVATIEADTTEEG